MSDERKAEEATRAFAREEALESRADRHLWSHLPDRQQELARSAFRAGWQACENHCRRASPTRYIEAFPGQRVAADADSVTIERPEGGWRDWREHKPPDGPVWVAIEGTPEGGHEGMECVLLREAAVVERDAPGLGDGLLVERLQHVTMDLPMDGVGKMTLTVLGLNGPVELDAHLYGLTAWGCALIPADVPREDAGRAARAILRGAAYRATVEPEPES